MCVYIYVYMYVRMYNNVYQNTYIVNWYQYVSKAYTRILFERNL